MEIEFDPAKSEQNAKERGLPFDQVGGMDWLTALIDEDVRKTYPEHRYQSIGWIGERLHVVVFTPIPTGIRVISFRKANSREVKRYEQASQS